MRQDLVTPSQPAEEPGLCRGHDPDAGARHRRQHRDLQRRQRRHPQAAAVSGAANGWSSSPASFPALGFDQFWVSAPEFIEFRERNQSFQDVGAYRAGAVNLGTPEQPRRVNSAVITSELMPVLGVAPIRGRQFTRDDTLPGAEDVAVLSSEVWRSRVRRRRIGRRPRRSRSTARRRASSASCRRATTSTTRRCRSGCR